MKCYISSNDVAECISKHIRYNYYNVYIHLLIILASVAKHLRVNIFIQQITQQLNWVLIEYFFYNVNKDKYGG